MADPYDLAVVGGGILGLAHAYHAARRGKRVVLFDRDAQANGASIRNFGFITVTGQQAGECWNRARRTRDIWAEIAPQAGIEILQHGLLVVARRPEALAVLEAFTETQMGRAEVGAETGGETCRMLTASEVEARFPHIRPESLAGAMLSPHELRVESRDAIPRFAAWLQARWGVSIQYGTHVRDVAPPRIETSEGMVEAEATVVCPNDDMLTLFADRLAAYGLSRVALSMLRVQPAAGYRLGPAVMSDLSLVRYLGYAELPQAEPLLARLRAEQSTWLDNGIHLIAVQSADGSLVVGDSHHGAATPPPFASAEVERLILDELTATTGLTDLSVTQRWLGTYPSAPGRLMLVDRPSDAVRIAIVTSGTGASTGFAIAEEVIDDLFGPTGAGAA